MSEREQVIFELPVEGPVSWNTIARCAREAGMSVEDWTADALAAYVRMHERGIREEQAAVWPPPAQERRHIPAWRLRLGDWLQRMADKCLDDGAEI